MSTAVKVGKKRNVNGLILYEKDWFRQGWVYKDEDAFLNRPDDVCYIPEFSYSLDEEDKYTGTDILKICNNNVAAAKEVFELLDWAHPETVYDELLKEVKDDAELKERLNL